jgi:hypothetical protein
MPEITVSIEGVQKLFQKLNPQKACGPDQIPARIPQKWLDPSLYGISDTVVIKFLQESFMWYSIKSF